jgi:hypothetical protein
MELGLEDEVFLMRPLSFSCLPNQFYCIHGGVVEGFHIKAAFP